MFHQNNFICLCVLYLYDPYVLYVCMCACMNCTCVPVADGVHAHVCADDTQI